jgi:hypothetical protein
MQRLPKKGDHVSWETSQGRTSGTVEAVVRRTAKVKGHIAKATKDHPEVVVKSAKSGDTAIHKPEMLKKA